MNRFSDNGILLILFTESHEILPNPGYGMYEIDRNRGKNRILYSKKKNENLNLFL